MLLLRCAILYFGGKVIPKCDFQALPGLAKTHQIFFVETKMSENIINVMVFSSKKDEIS